VPEVELARLVPVVKETTTLEFYGYLGSPIVEGRWGISSLPAVPPDKSNSRLSA